MQQWVWLSTVQCCFCLVLIDAKTSGLTNTCTPTYSYINTPGHCVWGPFEEAVGGGRGGDGNEILWQWRAQGSVHTASLHKEGGCSSGLLCVVLATKCMVKWWVSEPVIVVMHSWDWPSSLQSQLGLTLVTAVTAVIDPRHCSHSCDWSSSLQSQLGLTLVAAVTAVIDPCHKALIDHRYCNHSCDWPSSQGSNWHRHCNHSYDGPLSLLWLILVTAVTAVMITNVGAWLMWGFLGWLSNCPTADDIVKSSVEIHFWKSATPNHP